MGSLVSVVVAEIVMQNIEEQAQATLVIICLALYSAPNKNVTYIVDFQVLRVKIVNFEQSLTRTLFGMQ